MRPWHLMPLLLAIQPVWAGASEPPYYGPMKAWHGIGFKFGFKQEAQADGTWRVTAATRRTDAIDMAMYRVAQLAREQGFAYVELLRASESTSPGDNSATVYARLSHSPAPPAGCRPARRQTCYTADVAAVMHVLGGPGGTQPGVPIVDHLDEYGRAVSFSGFGVGAVATTAARTPPAPQPAAPSPLVGEVRVATVSADSASTARYDQSVRYEQALKDAQPVRHREPHLGWTISD